MNYLVSVTRTENGLALCTPVFWGVTEVVVGLHAPCQVQLHARMNRRCCREQEHMEKHRLYQLPRKSCHGVNVG